MLLHLAAGLPACRPALLASDFSPPVQSSPKAINNMPEERKGRELGSALCPAALPCSLL